MTRDQIQTVLDALQGYQPYAQVGTQVRQKTDESIAILQAALAEPEGEPSTVLRLIDTIKYLVGIAERGEGRKARDDELPEQFVLGYVKRLEAALAEPSEAVAEVAGDYNTKHIIFLPVGIALEVGDKLFTHPASKPEPSEADDTSCPTCGEDGGTSCGMPNCGLLIGESDVEPQNEPVAWQLGHRFYTSLKDAEYAWRNDCAFLGTSYVPEPLFTHPASKPEPSEPDCSPNHLCNGRMVHLPNGEQCDKCGETP